MPINNIYYLSFGDVNPFYSHCEVILRLKKVSLGRMLMILALIPLETVISLNPNKR